MMRIRIVGRINDHQSGFIYDPNGISPTLAARDFKEAVKIVDGVKYPNGASKEGYTIAQEGDGVKIYPNPARENSGGTVQKQSTGALNTYQGCGSGVVVRYPCNNREGFMVAKEGDGVVATRPDKCGKTVHDGISPTCNTYKGCGSGVVVKVLTRKRTEFGKAVRKDYERGRTELSRNDMTVLEPRDDEMSNTITTVKKDNILVAGTLDGNVVQDKQVYDANGISPSCMGSEGSGSKIKIMREIEVDDGETAAVQTPLFANTQKNGKGYKNDGTSYTCTGVPDGIAQSDNGKLRIRYLTPRECLRLQAFPDDAIDRLQAVLSKTALYKVAGNSIAVCCLKAIFKGIYIDKTFKQGTRQISLDKWF